MFRTMKNPLLKKLYHAFVCKWYTAKTFRGGWILTHSFYTDYKQHKANYWKIARTHLKGWSYNDWCILGISDANRKAYLSTENYASLHPLNGTYSYWIDDKLTLKYVLNGTKAGDYMPNYYYELLLDGRIIGLMDLPKGYGSTAHDVARLLRDKHLLAFKLVKGSLGAGFYRAKYEGGLYWLNEESMDESSFVQRVESLKGYLVTEYLLPHPEIAKLCSQSVGCLRYIVGRKLNGDLIDIYSFMRFGTQRSKFVENYNAGGVLAIIRDGRYSEGNVIDMGTLDNIVITKHPDTGVSLQGEIPQWEEIKQTAHVVAEVLPQMQYMGIDFCVTHDSKVKIIEINSLSSLDSIQIDKPIFETPGGEFFKERLTQKVN